MPSLLDYERIVWHNLAVRVAQVVLDVSAAELEDAYTYEVPDGMELSRGDGLLVPFGPRTVVGFVESLSAADESEFDYKLRRGVSPTRNAIKILRLMNFPDQLVADANRIVDETLRSGGQRPAREV
jgi:hypothetical protein